MVIQIKSRTSQLRGEIKTKAQGLAASDYAIDSTKMTQDEIKAAVKNLTNKVAFTFRDPKTVSGVRMSILFPIHPFCSGKANMPMLSLHESSHSSTWQRRSLAKLLATM